MTTMISNLPRDLIEEILFRVPSKSMREVRITCKTWDSLSKTRSFSKIHIGKEASATREGESQMIVMMNKNLHLMSFFVDGDPSFETKGKLTCGNEQVKISQVFNCEGLLLCTLEDDTKVVVWNPYWGQIRWIEPRYSQRGVDEWALGYVNKKNKSCRSHKILRSYYDSSLWYEIYDFDSGLWMTLDVPSQWRITSNAPGVSLKGNTYFCATKTNSEEALDDHLICYDFTSERFGPLLPFPFSAGQHDYVTLSCVREEKLAVLLTHDESNRYELDVWITTKIEPEKASWSKFLTLDTEPNYPISPICFFIDEEKKLVMGFDEDDTGSNQHILSVVGEAGYLRRSVLGDNNCRVRTPTHVFSYVPSLVQIKKVARGKRKRQSYLEKRRYDEKMLRLVARLSPIKGKFFKTLCISFKRKKRSKSAGGGRRRKREN